MERTPVKVLLGREASDGNLRIDALWQQASEITSVSTVCSFSYHIVTVFLLYVNAVALVALFFSGEIPLGRVFWLWEETRKKKHSHTGNTHKLHTDWLTDWGLNQQIGDLVAVKARVLTTFATMWPMTFIRLQCERSTPLKGPAPVEYVGC